MKTIFFLLMFLLTFALRGATPAFQDFNTGQFDVTGNKVAITNTASVSNLVMHGVANKLPDVGASKFVTLDSSGRLASSGSSLNLFNTLLDPDGSGSVVVGTSPSFSTSVILNYATANTLMQANGTKSLVSFPNGTESFLLGISNSAPSWITNVSALYVTNLNVTTIKINGRVASDVSVNGTTVAPANFQDSATVTYAVSGSNITATASASGSSVYVNGTSVSNPNLKDSSSIAYAISAVTNISPAIVAQAFNALTYSSATNVTLDCSLGNNMEAQYSLTITNTTFFATPTSVPSTAKGFVVLLKMNATGGYAVTFTNTTFKFPGGIVPVPDTNANAVSILTFTTSPFTAGQLYGGTALLDVK